MTHERSQHGIGPSIPAFCKGDRVIGTAAARRAEFGWRSLVLVLLAAGLMGCGSEPAPVVQPPATPPPPAFQPEAIEVKSAGGITVATLMTSQAGGHTLNGEPFDGGDLEVDGRTYAVALVDGGWVATFRPVEAEVALGSSGHMVTLMTTESGGWTLNGEAFEAGNVMTGDGRSYSLSLVDGQWTATFLPQTLDVPLGGSGESLAIVTTEDGAHTLNGEVFDGGRITVAGRDYDVTMAGGTWSATYRPRSVELTLGRSGNSVTLMTTESGGWTLNGEPFAAGTHEIGGFAYIFALVDGVWSARLDAEIQRVALGGSGGTVDIFRAEDGTWLLNGAVVANNSRHRTPSGTYYRLTIDDEGRWTGTFVPLPTSIGNTTAVAYLREDRSGYDVDGAEGTLDSLGSGEIQIGDHKFSVSRNGDGSLTGSLSDSLVAALYISDGALDGSGVGLTGDGRSLRIGHADDGRGDVEIPLADLVPDGMAEIGGSRIAGSVRDSVVRKLAQFRNWVALSSADSAYLSEKQALWNDVNADLAARLGIEGTAGGADILPPLQIRSGAAERTEDEAEAIAALEAVVAALSDPSAFRAALGPAGIFADNLAYGPEQAAAVFGASTSLTEVGHGEVASTGLRFGAWSHRTRENAHDELANIAQGAYAWSSTLNQTRWVDMPVRGAALYRGETVAIDTHNAFVDGTVSIEVDFSDLTVETALEHLTDRESGTTWHDGDGYVNSVKLPVAAIARNGSTNSSPTVFRVAAGGGSATVSYEALTASPQVVTNADSTRSASVSGQFLGANVVGATAAAPPGAIGTYVLDPDAANATSGLRGGFGASFSAFLPSSAFGPSSRPRSGSGFETDFGTGAFTSTDVKWSSPLFPAGDLDSDGKRPSGSGANYYLVDPLDGGELEVFLWDANDEPREHAFSIDTLRNVGRDSIDGDTFVSMALGDGSATDTSGLLYLADQLDRILNGLESGLTIDDAQELYRRANNKIATTMGLGSTNATVSTGSWDANSPLPDPVQPGDDEFSIETIRDTVRAAVDSLASQALFKRAVEDGNPFATKLTGDDGAYDAEAAYPRLQTSVSARFAFTDFTRFGIWKSEERDHAMDGTAVVVTSAFAYSTLGSVAWTANDRLPAGGAYFYGRTLAVGGGIDASGHLTGSDADATLYEGAMSLRVDWDTGNDDFAVHAIINELRDASGNRWNNGSGFVDRIELRATGLQPEGSALAFSGQLPAAGIDVDYSASGGGVSPPDADARYAGTLTGIFLGYDDETGPRAVVGNWRIDSAMANLAPIQGVYGADRATVAGTLP